MAHLHILIISCVLLAGCAAPQQAAKNAEYELVKNLKRTVIEMPTVGELRSGYLGNTLLHKEASTTGPAYSIAAETTTSSVEDRACFSFPRVTFKTATSKFIETKYISDDPERNEDLLCGEIIADAKVVFASGVQAGTSYDINSSRNTICKDLIDNRFYWVHLARVQAPCGAPPSERKFERLGVFPEGSVREVTKDVRDEEFYRLEMIYNGRVGDAVKFIYREFRDGVARPSFTQEVQYDLGISNMIGFKEARLEVIEATNTEIKYIVRKHFD